MLRFQFTLPPIRGCRPGGNCKRGPNLMRKRKEVAQRNRKFQQFHMEDLIPDGNHDVIIYLNLLSYGLGQCPDSYNIMEI